MTNIANSSIDPATPAAENPLQDIEAFQLSKLSSILNGLEGGASAIRRHVVEAMRSVRSGTYRIDPLQLSRRIVGEALGSS